MLFFTFRAKGDSSVNANDLRFGEVFAQRPPFQVPKYQRSYAWEDEELKDFVRDLEQLYKARQSQAEKKHFFGGGGCLQHVAQNGFGRKYEVIDGQPTPRSFLPSSPPPPSPITTLPPPLPPPHQ